MSVKYYKQVDNRYSRENDDSKCNQLISELGNEFKNDNFRLFCKKITGAIGEYSVMPTLVNLDKYRCKYFNLWICDHISKLSGMLNNPKFNDFKTKITNIWKENNLDSTCTWHFISYIDDSDYDKIKKLYDYAINYHTFKSYFDIRNKPCNTEDKNYIEESLRIYEEAKHKCKSVSDAKSLLCTALKDVQSEYKNDELSTITCNGEISIDKIRAEVQRSLTEQQVELNPQAGALQTDGDQSEIENPVQSHESTPEETSSFSNTQKATTVVFPLFGILLSFFLFYKVNLNNTLTHKYLIHKQFSDYA